jgi:hypothetical protein
VASTPSLAVKSSGGEVSAASDQEIKGDVDGHIMASVDLAIGHVIQLVIESHYLRTPSSRRRTHNEIRPTDGHLDCSVEFPTSNRMLLIVRRIRNHSSSANGGTDDDPRAYHDHVLDDVLPFKRWHVWDDSEDFGRKKDEWSQSAQHLHV